MAVIFSVGIVETVLQKTQTDPTTQTDPELSSPPEIDVKAVEFASKQKVESVYGVPSGYEVCCNDGGPDFNIAHYPWGDVTYRPDGKTDHIWYCYRVHPHSLESALKRVGLEKTSEPLRFVNLYRWCPTCSPPSPALFNGDLKMDVILMDDRQNDGFEAIQVGFEDWTGQDLLNKPLK